MNQKREEKTNNNQDEIKITSNTIINFIENKIEDILVKSIDNIINPGAIDKIFETIIQKKHNNEY